MLKNLILSYYYVQFFNVRILFLFHSSIGMMIRKIPVSESWEKVFEEILKNPYLMFISFIIVAPILRKCL